MYTETEKPIRCRAFQTNANVAADIFFFIESKNVPPDRPQSDFIQNRL